MVILTFGSSTTWGSWDTQGGWADRLKDFAFQKSGEINYQEYVSVYNLGVDGDNTERLLKRFETEIQARMYGEKDLTIIMFVGLNDSQYLLKEKQHWVQPQDFENNLQKLTEIAKKFNAHILFLGVTPVDSRVDPMPWKKDASYKMEYRIKYNDIIKTFCAKEKISFIDLVNKFPQGDPNPILVDGVHPNTKGHEIIFEEVKKYLTINNLI